MGFMVSKSTGLDSRLQRKKLFWKICIESRDIGQNVSNFAGLVWKADFGHFFGNISGLGAYFSKPIFALKSWVQAGRFEYHEPHNLSKFFFAFKGVRAKLWRNRCISHQTPSCFLIFHSNLQCMQATVSCSPDLVQIHVAHLRFNHFSSDGRQFHLELWTPWF